jgi:hypothetical protein
MQNTLSRVLFVPRSGLRTIDHTEPFHDSIKVSLPK